MKRSSLPLAGFFLASGTAHLSFGKKFFEAMVPAWVPGTPAQVNTAAGIAELSGGALVLVPGLERQARLYLIALLLAVYPANVQMALAPHTLRGSRGVPRWVLWIRLPLQILPIWWVDRVLSDSS